MNIGPCMSNLQTCHEAITYSWKSPTNIAATYLHSDVAGVAHIVITLIALRLQPLKSATTLAHPAMMKLAVSSAKAVRYLKIRHAIFFSVALRNPSHLSLKVCIDKFSLQLIQRWRTKTFPLTIV